MIKDTLPKGYEMQQALRAKHNDSLTLFVRSEIEGLGKEIGLSAQDAIATFENLKTQVWDGDYIPTDYGQPWSAVWIERVY